MSGIWWRDEEHSFQPLTHPLWDYNDNVLGSLLSPCLDPSVSPQRSSILQYLIYSLGTKQSSIGHSTVLQQPCFVMLFDGCYLHMASLSVRECHIAVYTGQDLVKVVSDGILLGTWCWVFVIKKNDTGWAENIPLPYAHTVEIINISLQRFPPIIFMRQICHIEEMAGS